MKERLTGRDWEILSAYLDGVVTPEERRLIETRLSADVEFSSAFQSLSRTRGILRSAPKIKRRRNFFLTQAMVHRPGWFWLVPAVNFSSAAAAILAVIFLLIDILPMVSGTAPTALQKESAPIVQALNESPASSSDQVDPAFAGAQTSEFVEESQELADSTAHETITSEPGLMAAPPPAAMEGEPPLPRAEVEEGLTSEYVTGNAVDEPMDASGKAGVSTPSLTAPFMPAVSLPTGTPASVSGEIIEEAVQPTPTILFRLETTTDPKSRIDPTPSPMDMDAWVQPEEATGDREKGKPSLTGSSKAGILLIFSLILAAAGFVLKRVIRE